MDIVAIVNELRKELQQIDSLILALDSLQHGRRRGRPPKILQQLRSGAKPGEPSSKRTSKKAQGKASKKTRKKTGKRGRPRRKAAA